MMKRLISRGKPASKRRASGSDLLGALSAIDTPPTLTDDSALIYGKLLRSKGADAWETMGAKKALALFHSASARIPAYKDFLKKNDISASTIQTTNDFSKVPPTTKENYIQTYSLAARNWEGKLSHETIFAVSSGTSGMPTIWPRGTGQEQEAILTHELLFTELFHIEKYRTLALVCFPMGVYISGMATAFPLHAIAARYPNFSIATVSNDKQTALKILQTVHTEYDQIILAGHPFLIKDIIEEGAGAGIDWSKVRLSGFFCSEGFNEVWRAHVAATGKTEPHKLFNMYGSSEFLLMGYENPLTIALRMHADADSTFRARLAEDDMTPNLFQYNPLLRYFEKDGYNLLITATSGIPLIRYNMHDAGTLISNENMLNMTKDVPGVKEILADPQWVPWNLPFVTLSGRSDRTLILYAANIYPEHVSYALNDERFLGALTGKFVMEKKYLKNMDQEFIIHVELRNNVAEDASLGQALQKNITETLLRVNSEYADATIKMRKNMKPSIVFHRNGDEIYFKPGLKPRFIKAGT